MAIRGILRPSRRGDGADSDVASSLRRPKVNARDVAIVHELGSDLQAEPQELMIYIEPSEFPTRLVVKSEVQTDGARRLRSAAYMATVRRREVKAMAKEFTALVQNSRQDDLALGTFPVTQRIKKLLNTLEDTEQEGNTREILRRIRDSIQNGGWEHYRKPEVCKVVASILGELAEIEEVLPGHVSTAAAKMTGVGLNSVRHLFDLIDDNDSLDAAE